MIRLVYRLVYTAYASGATMKSMKASKNGATNQTPWRAGDRAPRRGRWPFGTTAWRGATCVAALLNGCSLQPGDQRRSGGHLETLLLGVVDQHGLELGERRLQR